MLTLDPVMILEVGSRASLNTYIVPKRCADELQQT
jgi:hypothetical protein